MATLDSRVLGGSCRLVKNTMVLNALQRLVPRVLVFLLRLSLTAMELRNSALVVSVVSCDADSAGLSDMFS